MQGLAGGHLVGEFLRVVGTLGKLQGLSIPREQALDAAQLRLSARLPFQIVRSFTSG